MTPHAPVTRGELLDGARQLPRVNDPAGAEEAVLLRVRVGAVHLHRADREDDRLSGAPPQDAVDVVVVPSVATDDHHRKDERLDEERA